MLIKANKFYFHGIEKLIFDQQGFGAMMMAKEASHS